MPTGWRLVNLVLSLFNFGLLIYLIPAVLWEDSVPYDPKYRDALHAAAELGRLDAISALMAIIALGLGVFALCSFGYARYLVREAAETAALAETNKLVPQILPGLVAEHMLLLRNNTPDPAEKYGESQPKDGHAV